MAKSSRVLDVEAVDAYLAEPKLLTEALPEWTQHHIPGRWTAVWPIMDEAGIVEASNHLRFVGKCDDPAYTSISLMWDNNRVHAVDMVPGQVEKDNPSDASRRFGLPARVNGSHFHQWEHNRHVALAVGLERLPYRSPTPKLLTRLPHGLAALAQQINLTLTPEQATFDVPPQGLMLLKREADNDDV